MLAKAQSNASSCGETVALK